MTKARVAGGFLTQEEADALVKQYESDINRYTYLRIVVICHLVTGYQDMLWTSSLTNDVRTKP